jgi:hypothetical protein
VLFVGVVTLIPIEHVRTLRSPEEAVALFKALGERTVALRGFHTTDATRIARVIHAVATRFDHTVSFEGGAIAPAALRELAVSRAYDYLDVRTPLANLRIWPERTSWVTSTEPTFETTSIGAAVERFEMIAGKRHERGFVMRMREAAKPLVTSLVIAFEATINALIEVELATARELTSLYAGEPLEWAAGSIFVRFPAGAIAGFLKTPKVDPKHQAKWHARIDKALKKARLSPP